MTVLTDEGSSTISVSLDTSEPYEERLAAVIRLFGYASLSPDQDTLIRASIVGRDVLGVLPTGGGKSACYQIPGVVTRSKTLVVSPLIALQDDQVRALRRLNIKAFAFHSGMNSIQRMAAHYYFKTAPPDEASFLYISPELLLTELFRDKFAGVQFGRIAVDEAHCVSTWGDTFRPDYQRIKLAVKRMHIPQCSAFTATIDVKIEQDIRKRIPLRPSYLKVSADPMRENLELVVERPKASVGSGPRLGSARFKRLLQLTVDEEFSGPIIVYYNSRNGAAAVYLRLRKMQAFLQRTGYSPYLYHAGLPYEDKEAALYGFINDPKTIVIATSAFGMGIDRADVRQIIHYSTPKNLIEYAQQFGRGGRDGKPARCTTFHFTDRTTEQEVERVKSSVPSYDFVEHTLDRLKKRLDKLSVAKRRSYDIHKFMYQTEKGVRNNGRITRPDLYMDRFLATMGMLQQVGAVSENSDGLMVHRLVPGSAMQAALLKRTQMHERMVVRERERAARFFGTPGATQTLLWKILREP